MPGLYAEGDDDLAGFALGAVDRGGVLPRLQRQAAGDVLIGLASSGAHANGFSLVRKIVERAGLAWSAPAPFAPGQTLAEAFMVPTRIYVQSVLPLVRADLVEGIAHITGGGLIENPPRAIASGLVPRFDWSAWPLPPLFAWMQEVAGVTDQELRRTFNCGVGMVLVTKPDNVTAALGMLARSGETAFPCGVLAAV